MKPKRRQKTNAKVWSVEPKAPSLVSLSIRDQNVPRPPKRSSSLKTAASGLKKGLSHHNLLNASAQDSLQTLRRGKYQSCSSLQVDKTRHKPIIIRDLPSTAESGEEQLLLNHDDDAGSSDGTLLDVVEHYWDGLSKLPGLSSVTKRIVGVRSEAVTRHASSETVVHSEAAGLSRPSSGLTNNTYYTASRSSRHHSARRLMSRVFSSRSKNSTEQDLTPTAARVEAWVEDARSDSCLNTATPAHLTSFDALGLRQEDQYARTSSAEYVAQIRSSPPPLPPVAQDEQVQPRTPRSKSTRQVYASLRLRLTAKTEVNEATLTSEEYVWAVAQIHAELASPSAHGLANTSSIAVAIVLDNSRLATRKDVKKACLEILTLAANLEEGVDHVGVYCTSGSNISDTCLLSVANPLDIETLQHRLDKVPQRPRDSFRVEDAFLQAAQALRTMRSQRVAPMIKEDIVVVTSSAFGLTACFEQNIEDFRVHLVNPSLIPYSSKVRHQIMSLRGSQLGHIRGTPPRELSTHQSGPNGWLVDSSRCLGDDCDTHKSHTLTDVILHSKTQYEGGAINNVSIHVRELQDATIEEVVGDLDYPSLLPGQMVSVAIKIKLASLGDQSAVEVGAERDCPSRSSMLDAISDLEITLGNHFSELFEVRVTYNHSMFPCNTMLEARESCWLSRNLAAKRDTSCFNGEDTSFDPLKYNTRVQKQLALCIAGSNPPTDALRLLEDNFSNITLSEGVSNFLDALSRRLKHRLALYADVTFMDYLLASEYIESPPPTPLRRDTSYERMLGEIVDGRQDVYDDGFDTPKTIVRRKAPNLYASNEIDEGEARRIWQHIRRTSRRDPAPESPHVEPDVIIDGRLERHEPHIEQIRETALKHGRKISSATLRSLAKDFRRLNPSFVEEGEDEGSVALHC